MSDAARRRELNRVGDDAIDAEAGGYAVESALVFAEVGRDYGSDTSVELHSTGFGQILVSVAYEGADETVINAAAYMASDAARELGESLLALADHVEGGDDA